MLTTAEKVRNVLVGALAGVVVVVAVALVTDGDDGTATSGATTTTEPTSTTEPTTSSTTADTLETTSSPTSTTTASAQESAAEFAERFVAAIRDGDAGFLFGRLAEETLARYGQDQCRTYTGRLQDDQFALELRDVATEQEWAYETDGQSETIHDVTAIELERADASGQTVIQEIHLVRRGSVFHWFTDCGDPV